MAAVVRQLEIEAAICSVLAMALVEHGNSRSRIGSTTTWLSAEYWELHFSLYNAADVAIPAAVSVFPGEAYEAPRSWAEQAYHKLIYYNKAAEGGHFAAWERPQLFAAEVRAGFKSLR